MALNYPDILQHNNSAYPIVDSNNILGSVFVTGSDTEQYGISEYKRKLGMIVYFSSSQDFKYYKGGTTSSGDWGTAANWEVLGSSQIYTAGDGLNLVGNIFSSKVLTVNGQNPDGSGNITTALTAVETGNSASLVQSSSGAVTASITNGTVWIISNDGDATKNGDTYIFKSGSVGQWYQISPLDEVAGDARYVRLSASSTQNITSSLLISGSTTFTGSLSWSGSSNANGATANVVVLSNGQLYVTGAYGSGGATPGGADKTIQFNDGGSTLSGSGTFTFDKTTNTVSISGSLLSTGSLISSGSLRVIGTETITGSLIVSSSSNVIGTSRVTGSLIVSNSLQVIGTGSITGSLIVSRSTDNTATIVGSGSSNPLLNVLGSQGQLFSVYDTLSGSLFSVNDISGLPILEVKSDTTTLIGSYQAPALHTSRRIVTTVGNNVIYNGIPTASYNAAIIDYNLTSASYAKVGSIMTAWSSSTITTQTEYATASVAGANYPTMSLQISGANLIVTASAAAANWVIKTIIRSI
jgi:hypothetical protein